MSLLPGLEEDSGEYFDETFNVLDSVRQKLEDDAFFWQCLWLCIITSPQQRQGALKYLFKCFPVLKDNSNGRNLYLLLAVEFNFLRYSSNNTS